LSVVLRVESQPCRELTYEIILTAKEPAKAANCLPTGHNSGDFTTVETKISWYNFGSKSNQSSKTDE